MAGPRAAVPESRPAGSLVVIGCGQPEHIEAFRAVTGYDGPLFTDPSLRAFGTAGLARGWTKTFDPRSVVKGVAAFMGGFRQGARRGNPFQQGGTFIIGAGPRVRFEWRDRFAGIIPRCATSPPPSRRPATCVDRRRLVDAESHQVLLGLGG